MKLTLRAGLVGCEPSRDSMVWSWFDLISILIVCTISFYASGIGFIASDDFGYIEAARGWLHHFPFISNFFGDLRHPAVLPMAASIAVLGDSEFAAELPNIAYTFGCVVISYFGLMALVDRWTGLIAATLLAISPLFSELSTTPGVDVPELFFVVASVFTFLFGIQRKCFWPVFFVAGIMSGFALSARESSVEIFIFYGILFLAGFGGRRHIYWVMAAGFFAVPLSEMAIYALTVGDPLHRIHAVLSAFSQPDPKGTTGFVDFSATRIFDVSPFIDPFIFAVAHPKFALIFPVGVGAIVWAFRAKREGLDSRGLVLIWGLLAGISFLLAASVLSYLALLPRYYLVSAFGMIAAVAVWMRSGLWPYYRRTCIALASVLVLASVSGSAIANKSPLFAEHVLATVARASTDRIHTDVETAYRATLLIQWANAADRVTSDPPGPNDLYLFNPKYVGKTTPRTTATGRVVSPVQPAWVAVQRFEEPERPLSVMLRSIGLYRLLPAALVRRIAAPNPPVVLYRLPP